MKGRGVLFIFSLDSHVYSCMYYTSNEQQYRNKSVKIFRCGNLAHKTWSPVSNCAVIELTV